MEIEEALQSLISNLQSQILYRHMRCVCMPHVSACQHVALNRAEPGAQAVIEHLIADPNDQPAQLDYSQIGELAHTIDQLKAEVEQAREGKDSLRSGIQSFMAAGMGMTMDIFGKLPDEVNHM